MTGTITWAGIVAALGVLTGLVKLAVEVRKAWQGDRRDMNRLADILRRDIYLTLKRSEPNREERLKALLREVNPIRDRLWVARGKPGARQPK